MVGKVAAGLIGVGLLLALTQAAALGADDTSPIVRYMRQRVPDVPPIPVPLPQRLPAELPKVDSERATIGEKVGPTRKEKLAARTAINFTGPAGTKVTWQLPDGKFNETDVLTAPTQANFRRGEVYRLKVTSKGDRAFYPTLEVPPAAKESAAYLKRCCVPVAFSAEEFKRAKEGELVVKVVYLPDPEEQDFSTVIAAEELASTRLEPGTDAVAEARRRGTVLAVIRLGNIDLEAGSGIPGCATGRGAVRSAPRK
jgi:hypothetical protein